MTDTYELVNARPDGMPYKTCAVIAAYDAESLTVRPPDGTPSGAIFNPDGIVVVQSFRVNEGLLYQDRALFKVGDPTMNDDGTQCYPILDRAGHADVRAGAIALYASSEQE